MPFAGCLPKFLRFHPRSSLSAVETIDRVVREFLTPAEGVIEAGVSSLDPPSSPLHSPAPSAARKIRDTPMMLLPRMGPGHPSILDTVEMRLLAGSEREKSADGSLGDYVDGCENHFLLADAYSKLAEVICQAARRPKFAYESISP